MGGVGGVDGEVKRVWCVERVSVLLLLLVLVSLSNGLNEREENKGVKRGATDAGILNKGVNTICCDGWTDENNKRHRALVKSGASRLGARWVVVPCWLLAAGCWIHSEGETETEQLLLPLPCH